MKLIEGYCELCEETREFKNTEGKEYLPCPECTSLCYVSCSGSSIDTNEVTHVSHTSDRIGTWLTSLFSNLNHHSDIENMEDIESYMREVMEKGDDKPTHSDTMNELLRTSRMVRFSDVTAPHVAVDKHVFPASISSFSREVCVEDEDVVVVDGISILSNPLTLSTPLESLPHDLSKPPVFLACRGDVSFATKVNHASDSLSKLSNNPMNPTSTQPSSANCSSHPPVFMVVGQTTSDFPYTMRDGADECKNPNNIAVLVAKSSFDQIVSLHDQSPNVDIGIVYCSKPIMCVICADNILPSLSPSGSGSLFQCPPHTPNITVGNYNVPDCSSLLTTLPCNHQYHTSCIFPWLLKANTCPTCRFYLPCERPDVKNETINHTENLFL